MKYLIMGAIIALSGIGLIQIDYNLIGIIVMIAGLAIGLKGCRELDESKT